MAAEFSEMAIALLAEPDVDHTLDGIVLFAKESLGGDHAGIHIMQKQTIETAAATDPVVAHASKLQEELGEGPCLQAVWSHDTFVVGDAATDERWPAYGPKAAELGMHSILSVRLHTSAETLGALNIYSRGVREFSDDDVAQAHIFGQHASVALATAKREDGLRKAVDSRTAIGQAQGILMERFGLTVDQAFAVLRRYSQTYNVKLRSVADRLIETRELPE